LIKQAKRNIFAMSATLDSKIFLFDFGLIEFYTVTSFVN